MSLGDTHIMMFYGRAESVNLTHNTKFITITFTTTFITINENYYKKIELSFRWKTLSLF